MNLRQIANGVTQAVNPNIIGAVQVSTGATQNPDYTRTPTFQVFSNVSMQVQAMSAGNLRQVEKLNLQGVVRAVYLNGVIEGLDRPAGKGGDLLLFNGETWLVVAVLEPWSTSGWVKVAVTLQMPGA